MSLNKSKPMSIKEAHSFILTKAKEHGVDAESVASESRKLTLDAFNNELSQITQATQGGIGIRVIKNGKTGYASTEEVSAEALEWAFNEALENADLQTDTSGFIPKSQKLGYQDLISEGLSAAIEEKANAALELEKTLRADSRLQQAVTNRYSETETQTSLSSTQGAEGGYRNGFSFLMSSFIMKQGDSLKQDFGFQVEKEFHALEPGKTALNMLEKTGRMLGAGPLKTGKYTAYFEPKAFAQILGLVIYMLNGKSVKDGRSRLADKIGEQVASEQLTLIDDPDLEGGKANIPFDAEGTTAKKITLIDKGILKAFLHNSATAKELGQDNTGRASRGYKGTLGISPSNFYVKPADKPLEPKNGVIITDLMGVHAGANPISGDFSLQAFGIHVEDGKQTPVENFAIAGNLLNMLQNISAVGDTLEWLPFSGLVGSPLIEVSELSFAGE